MRPTLKWLLSAAVLATVAGGMPATAQPYGDRDDGPPPFRRGSGWDGPPRGPWDRWHHHRRWHDDEFGRRDGDRREGRERFGNEGDDRGNRDRLRENARRDGGNDDGPRRGEPGRGGPPRFSHDDD